MPISSPGGQPSAIDRLRSALNLLVDGQPEGMTVGLLRSFLTVALYPDRSLREYQDLLDMSQSTMSRHLLDLGEMNRKRLPGLKLIDQHTDPMDRRKNVYRLTAKGRALVTALERALGSEGTS